MRCSQSARNLTFAGWAMVAALGAVSCGKGDVSPMMSHQSAALNQNGYVASEHGAFSIHIDWLSGNPVATKDASARVLFLNAAGGSATTLSIEKVQTVMSCCEEAGPEPQVATEGATSAAERDIGGIRATRSGNWELRVQAQVDGSASDIATWKFSAGVP